MPAHFGPYKEHLCGYEGAPIAATYRDVSMIVVTYETEWQALERYIPEPFEVKEPVISVSFNMNQNVEWMAGGTYKLVAVDVPVIYDYAGQHLEGSFSLVVWESKATPCYPGREVMGIPKIFADIEDFHHLGERMFSHASYEGVSFLEIEALKKRKLSADEVAAVNQDMEKAPFNWFGWRYIPNIGKPGAALSHATLFPQEIIFSDLYECEGKISWNAVTHEQNPTQAHIINALGRLPIKASRACYVSIGGTSHLRSDLARQLP